MKEDYDEAKVKFSVELPLTAPQISQFLLSLTPISRSRILNKDKTVRVKSTITTKKKSI